MTSTSHRAAPPRLSRAVLLAALVGCARPAVELHARTPAAEHAVRRPMSDFSWPRVDAACQPLPVGDARSRSVVLELVGDRVWFSGEEVGSFAAGGSLPERLSGVLAPLCAPEVLRCGGGPSVLLVVDAAAPSEYVLDLLAAAPFCAEETAILVADAALPDGSPPPTPAGGAAPVEIVLREDERVTIARIAYADQRVREMEARRAAAQEAPVADRPAASIASLRVDHPDVGCVALAVDEASRLPFGSVVRAWDDLRAQGITRHVFRSTAVPGARRAETSVAAPVDAAVPPDAAARPTRPLLRSTDVVSVLPLYPLPQHCFGLDVLSDGPATCECF